YHGQLCPARLVQQLHDGPVRSDRLLHARYEVRFLAGQHALWIVYLDRLLVLAAAAVGNLPQQQVFGGEHVRLQDRSMDGRSDNHGPGRLPALRVAVVRRAAGDEIEAGLADAVWKVMVFLVAHLGGDDGHCADSINSLAASAASAMIWLASCTGISSRSKIT